MKLGCLREMHTLKGKKIKTDYKITLVIFIDWALASRPVKGLFSFNGIVGDCGTDMKIGFQVHVGTLEKIIRRF